MVENVKVEVAKVNQPVVAAKVAPALAPQNPHLARAKLFKFKKQVPPAF